jgi:SLT domain-containing protein
LDSWINEARTILAANGYQVSYNAIYQAAMGESGGDPNAVNNWDYNAAAGHPSIGLLQTIQPTFDAFALDGHRDIYNPVDNIIAAARYAAATYGSLDEVVAARCGGSCWRGY